MLQSSAAYAPEVCSICSTAVAHMLQSISHMTENTVLESDITWKSHSTATFGDTYRHYHLPMTIYCFIGRWFGFWCLSCAPGLWRICCRGLQHMLRRCAAYAPEVCSILCSAALQHMLQSSGAYAPEVILTVLFLPLLWALAYETDPIQCICSGKNSVSTARYLQEPEIKILIFLIRF